MPELEPSLHELAEAYGIATEYWDWQGHHVSVAPGHVVAVLAGARRRRVDARRRPAAALDEHQRRPWTRMLPPLPGRSASTGPRRSRCTSPHGDPVEIWIELETGGRRGRCGSWRTGPRRGRSTAGWVGRGLASRSPRDLPLGYHTLRARSGERDGGDAADHHPGLARAPGPDGRAAGLGPGHPALQRPVAAVLGRRRPDRPGGSGRLVGRPSTAPTTSWSTRCTPPSRVPPMEPSPYLPTSRRFANPIYLRLGADPRVRRRSTPSQRAKIDGAAGRARRSGWPGPTAIDRNRSWTAKRKALRDHLRGAADRRAGQLASPAYRRREGEGCTDFATWAVLAEQHGPRLRRLAGRAAAPRLARGRRLRGRARATRSTSTAGCSGCWTSSWPPPSRPALRAGMALGIMHDLAVGVSPARRGRLGAAGHVRRRASPSERRRTRTTRTARTGASRRGGRTGWPRPRTRRSGRWSRTILRHAGGIRVDHVIGLFRLWWIPEGAGPTEGTYVRYDHEAMIGILALEAHRAGALVVGEDLGTVEPWVRTYLRERGILGTSILWFEFDWDGDAVAAGPGAVAGVLPGLGDHPRPAADRRLPGRRPRPAAGPARRPDPVRWPRSWPPTRPSARPGWTTCAGSGLLDGTPTRRRRCRRCTATSPWTPSRLLCVALDRRGRGPAGAEPAGHDRRVPELAGAAERPRRSARSGWRTCSTEPPRRRDAGRASSAAADPAEPPAATC